MLDFQLSNLQAKHLTKGVHFCVFYGIMDIMRHRVGGGRCIISRLLWLQGLHMTWQNCNDVVGACRALSFTSFFCARGFRAASLCARPKFSQG